MNGREHQAYIEQMARNRLAQVRGDIWQAYYSAVHDLHVLGLNVSTGLLRIGPSSAPGPHDDPPPSIEDPGTGTEHQAIADSDT